MAHWATEYIGKPWISTAKGPDAFDCWGLVVAVHKQLFNHDLPAIPVAENDLKSLILNMRDHPERQNWQIVTTLQEGDVALMRQSRHPIHVGIWLDIDGGGILHAVQGVGVIFQSINNLTITGWKIENFYRHIER